MGFQNNVFYSDFSTSYLRGHDHKWDVTKIGISRIGIKIDVLPTRIEKSPDEGHKKHTENNINVKGKPGKVKW
jgi:hypothetical protein